VIYQNKAISVTRDPHTPKPVMVVPFGRRFMYLYVCQTCQREFFVDVPYFEYPTVCHHCRVKEG